MTDRVRRAFIAATGAPGDRLDLDVEESHHVARVLRLKRGDALNVFDGAGREWTATIDEAAKDRVTVLIGPELEGRVEAALRATLWQANVRPEKLEWVLQKGTEVGVAAFRIFASERVEAPPPSPARLTRYRRILLEACKQSGRRVIPSLSVGELEAPDPGTLAIVLAPAARPIGALLAASAPREVVIAAGPEGGLTGAELSDFAEKGWRAASLGPRILRTETAGTIAAAVVMHRWGDLGSH